MAANTLTRCIRPAGYVAVATDCNDLNASVYPGRPEVCEAGGFSDQVDNDCDGDKNDVDPNLPVAGGGTRLWYGDADQDGHDDHRNPKVGARNDGGRECKHVINRLKDEPVERVNNHWGILPHAVARGITGGGVRVSMPSLVERSSVFHGG
ncbi:MAG: putative metal-binding motif-containing protein [Patescibacteria group bacterium]